MDRFDTMLAFTRVVELNSFTKASLSLNLPKSTLSTQINTLEKRLNVKLLHRSTRHVGVTPEGAAYYERAVRLLRELDEAEAEVSFLTSTPRGRLRVDLPSTLGRRVIVPALSNFMRRYPDIELQVGCTDREADLLQEGIDCAIRVGKIVDEALVAQRLGVAPMLTCASPHYLQQHGVPRTPDDLMAHYMVRFASPKSGRLHEFTYQAEGRVLTAPAKNRIVFNDVEACVIAARDGAGLLQAPEYMIREYLADGRLQTVLEEWPAPAVPFSILFPQNLHMSNKVRVFIDWSRELFASLFPAR